ncbi:RNA polymerase sigma factor [Alistipes sp.]|uniref:RNA polymerase sigma factor n=1 Tax=Alistipes sp. TaxID=1872444 RepID=UPI003AF1C3AB
MSNSAIDLRSLSDLRALMDRYSDDLFLFVRGIVHRAEIAEEIVSETFFRIWRRKEDGAGVENIRAFLFVVARNLSISYLRRTRRVRISSLDELADFRIEPVEAEPDADLDEERAEAINRAVAALPAKCKMAFLLAKVQGLKYAEIARIMNVSELTVKNEVAYALKKLRAKLG